MGIDELLTALADLLTPLGRPVFVMRAAGRPEVPYIVVKLPPPEMPDQQNPEPPEQRVMDGAAPQRNARVVIESVGRSLVDAAALDHKAWLAMTEDNPPEGIIHVGGLRAGTVEGHPHTLQTMRHAYTVTHR
jgi:hypothetical protein